MAEHGTRNTDNQHTPLPCVIPLTWSPCRRYASIFRVTAVEPLLYNSVTHKAEPLPGGGNPSGGLGELRGTVGEVLRIVSVRRWMFIVPFCLVISASFILSLYVPRRYTASTKFERRDDPVLVTSRNASGAS